VSNRIRKAGATALLLGALTSGALVIGTATASAAPAKTAGTTVTTTSHAVTPNICRFGCL
jgi:hypothetical protein